MDRPLNVLIVEDSIADAEISVLSLEGSGFKVRSRRVETELEYLMALRDAPDIVLSDHSMPAFDAHRALRLLREQGGDIPFIVVSGRIGESAAVELMKAGANDYIRKDNLERLAPAVRREIGEAENRRQARLTADKLYQQEHKLDSLMQNLPGMVYRLRLDEGTWRFDFVSDGCKELTGHDRRELVEGEGLDLKRLLHGEPGSAPQEALWRALSSDGYFTLEHQILCANGDVKWVWHRGVVIAETPGHPRYVEGFLADITAQKMDQAKLDYLAHHDVLTGMLNRAVFEEQLARSLERVKRHFQNVTLLFIDLDNFKDINDTWGHECGDAVLRTVAARITACGRKGDIMARLGGDEFAVVLDDNEKTEDVAQLVSRLLVEIARPIRWQQQDTTVTASIGVAVYPVDGEQVAVLLRNADAAMYAAKQAGRNAFRFATKKMNERAKSMVVMRNALYKGLRRDEFELHYQPTVRLSDNRIVGLEALVRWRYSNNTLMPAKHFIRFAEDAGVIASIDRLVIRGVCRQAREWDDAGVPFGRISFNLSAQTLSDQKIAELLEADIAEFGVDPHWLEIEVAETTIMQDMIATRVTLEKFADMGIALTLDGFGRGYSSLNSLKRFPISRLKIDQDFIKEIPWDEADVQTCRAIMALASSLHIEV
ncbi:MAG TPA: diguanylate cyclase, partial [Gammaproteobacteria bacterium]|nr:diguanylate cyclase [Gammaproteobacteria bacterium]